jgi:hypothetical protein
VKKTIAEWILSMPAEQRGRFALVALGWAVLTLGLIAAFGWVGLAIVGALVIVINL